MTEIDSGHLNGDPRPRIDTPTTPRTAIQDAILANLTPDLDAAAVAAVEWAALANTTAAVRRRDVTLRSPGATLVDFEAYRRADELREVA